MLAVPARALPSGRGWSYEVKWDGYRAQIVKRGSSISLASRNGKDLTRQFSSIAADARTIDAADAILDGEIVALDPHGRPSFQALHHRATAGLAVVYYAFDLLHLDGRDLVREPLDGRRALLKKVVAGSRVLQSEPLPGAPDEIAAAVKDMHLEGVVAKRRDSAYEPGRRSEAWVKVRFARRQEFVVGGFKPAGGSFDSILVGYYENSGAHKRRGAGAAPGKLLCAGKVRSGFTPATRTVLAGRLSPLITPRCPFVNLPTSRTSHWGEGITAEEMTTLRWVKPAIVVEVSFVEWTRDGSLRHASFEGLRDDKPPRDVAREP
jgi:bifunctional non-homologous end joining protein LigD